MHASARAWLQCFFFIRAWPKLIRIRAWPKTALADKWVRVLNSLSTPELLYLLQAAPEVALT
jgi:hypothetical protein